MTIFCLRDDFYRDTAPVPFRGLVYRDYNPTVYQTCTATAPAPNKICTMTAKSTPYLSCHRDSFLPKVPGQVPGWLRQVTQPPFIAGPLAFRQWASVHKTKYFEFIFQFDNKRDYIYLYFQVLGHKMIWI
jgi:hypothetical protein